MACISITNPRFRTKSQICADVSSVLGASLHYGTKFAVLAEVVWVWSEFNGKYVGCKYWSLAAWKVRESDQKWIHEHVVPKSVIIERLMALSAPTFQAVNDVLQRFCIGVVVTHEEDQRLNKLGLRAKMPEGWDGEYPWARYKAANIEVIAVN